jgi:hypothetical protein
MKLKRRYRKVLAYALDNDCVTNMFRDQLQDGTISRKRFRAWNELRELLGLEKVEPYTDAEKEL